MALVVEDGTGVVGANSYVAVADATTYHADRGNAAWAASTSPLQSAALSRASAAIDGIYGGRWPGTRGRTDTSGLSWPLAGPQQGLDWPRAYAWDRDGYPLTGVPTEVKNATCEAALVELDSPGALSKKGEAGLKSLTVGPISKTYAGASAAGAMAYPAIRQALARIIKGGGNIAIGGR